LVAERSQDRIEHQVQLPPNIFSKESQHQVSALLQQLIFPAIAAVGLHHSVHCPDLACTNIL